MRGERCHDCDRHMLAHRVACTPCASISASPAWKRVADRCRPLPIAVGFELYPRSLCRYIELAILITLNIALQLILVHCSSSRVVQCCNRNRAGANNRTRARTRTRSTNRTRLCMHFQSDSAVRSCAHAHVTCGVHMSTCAWKAATNAQSKSHGECPHMRMYKAATIAHSTPHDYRAVPLYISSLRQRRAFSSRSLRQQVGRIIAVHTL